MGLQTNVSHDTIYRFFRTKSESKAEIEGTLIQLIRPMGPGYLIIDDTRIAKIYANKIEWLTRDFDASKKHEVLGLSPVVVCWSNGEIIIPILFDYWCKKEFMGDYYRKKTKIASDLLEQFKSYNIPIKAVIADGIYATTEFLRTLINKGFTFELRAHTNRVVESKEGEFRLDRHPGLRLQRNERSKTIQADWYGMTLSFTVFKRKSDRKWLYTYQVSNIKCSAKEHIAIYGLRWAIEKAFRTMEQKLGLGDCMARSRYKQDSHIYAVFLAYTISQMQAIDKKYSSPDAFLSALRKPKSRLRVSKKPFRVRNFHDFA